MDSNQGWRGVIYPAPTEDAKAIQIRELTAALTAEKEENTKLILLSGKYAAALDVIEAAITAAK